MALDKIEINIDKVLQDNKNEENEIISKFKNLYNLYCNEEQQYDEEIKKISKEEKYLKKEINVNESEINKEKNLITNSFSEKKKKINEEFEIIRKNNINEYNNNLIELEKEKNSSGIIKKIIWVFNRYPQKKEEEIKNDYNTKKDNLIKENYNKIKDIEDEKNLKIYELNQKNKEILNKIKESYERIEFIQNRIIFLEKELIKLATKKTFIKNGDKDKCNEIYTEMNNIYNLELYPSITRINILKQETKKLMIRYQNKIHLLEDNDFNEIINMVNSNLLDAEYLKYKFIPKEKDRVKELLSDIDGKSLDEQQRDAVVTNEDNNLIVAGAGSGKTLTISAKVKYLVSRLNIKPKEILLITFTKKAAEEMQERIAKKLGIEVKVKTFHALGMEVLSLFDKEKLDVYDDIEVFTKKFIKNNVLNDEQLKKDIFKYFTTYINDYVDPENFDCLGEFYRSNKSNSLEAIEFKLRKIEANRDVIAFNEWLDDINFDFKKILKEKTIEGSNEKIEQFTEKLKKQLSEITDEYDEKENIIIDILNGMNNFKLRTKYIIEHKEQQEKEMLQRRINKKVEKLFKEKITMKYEKVKSLEELIIANYLFSCGIDYIYEGEYLQNTADNLHRQYKPDFYLPKYNIYIEHFGVNEEGRCPQYSKPEELKYLEGIKWKRELHKENGTIMEETYSFEHKNGQLINKINSILKKHNIPIKKLTSEEITKVIIDLNTDNEFKEFYKLLNTFLSLFKSCNFNETNIDKFISEAKMNNNEYVKEKHILFLKIFKIYYKEYVKELKEENKIDFNDMINNATNYITNNYLPPEFNFKYIIIDEFQDISVARYKLINSIKKYTNARVMAVGDDWQSIYRFAGSEIAIFTKFKEYFGETETLMIEKTYRNSQQLIDIAGKFIMNNPDQIKKNLKSDKKLDKPVVLVDYTENILKTDDENKNSLARRIMFILNSFDKKNNKTVLLLGRNNFDIFEIKNSEFFRIIEKGNETLIESNLYPNLEIKFMSVHKSKGIEADEVIVINNKNTLTGFPNKMVSDSVLKYVMTDEETFTYAEERRLFYVALTRTKNHCYLMCPDENSNFTEELKSYKEIEYLKCDDKEEKINCPICKTGYLVARKGYKDKIFYGCNNFPQCNFKTSDMTNVNSKVRCPSCGNFMSKRKGPYGEFYGCNSYPNCKTTYSIEEFEKLDKEGGE